MKNVSDCYAGLTYQEIWEQWSAKHGDTPQNRDSHRKWMILGKKIAAGARLERRGRK